MAVLAKASSIISKYVYLGINLRPQSVPDDKEDSYEMSVLRVPEPGRGSILQHVSAFIREIPTGTTFQTSTAPDDNPRE
jgi:hypothetical protein